MRAHFALVLLLIAVASSALARDCSVSREFRITNPQALSGTLEDPNGSVLSGFNLELLSGKDIFRQLRTDNNGEYDFGVVPLGRYRVRIRHDDVFCVPKILRGPQKCTLPRLILNSKKMVQVD